MMSRAVEQVLQRARDDLDFRQQLMRTPLTALAPYTLTDEERRQLILPNFGWLIEGRLAGSAQPGSADALALLREAGIGTVISLSEQPLPDTLTAPFDLAVVHLPVADFTAPTLAQIEQAVLTINAALANDRPVVVHCGAGLGRTGTILASYLVWHGQDAQAAIDLVRARRPGSIETPAQEVAVAAHADRRARPPEEPPATA